MKISTGRRSFMGRVPHGVVAPSFSKGVLGLSTTYATAEINEAARAILDKFGIGINRVANGVYLSNHKGRHSREYREMLFKRLRRAKTKEQALRILNQIRKDLLSGAIKL